MIKEATVEAELDHIKTNPIAVEALGPNACRKVSLALKITILSYLI